MMFFAPIMRSSAAFHANGLHCIERGGKLGREFVGYGCNRELGIHLGSVMFTN